MTSPGVSPSDSVPPVENRYRGAEPSQPVGSPSPSENGSAQEETVDLQFLHFLPDQVRTLVVGLLETRSYAFGDVIAAEGEPSDCLFLLAEGTVRVVKEDDTGTEVSLGLQGPGTTFGETGLLDGTPRSATVRASSAVKVLVLDAKVLDALMREYPAFRTALEAQRRFNVLNRFIRTRSVFATLSHSGTARLVAAMDQRAVDAGENVIAEGAPADALYVVQEGRLEVLSVEDGRSVTLRYLRAGDMFGESALEPGMRRTASVVAMEPTTLLSISGDDLRAIAGQFPALAERIDELVRSRRRLATVPLDFAEELLSVDAKTSERISEDTMDPGLSDAPDLPTAPPPTVHERRHRRRNRFPFVHQLDEMDCGAACLGMVARSYGRDVSLNFIRQESKVSVNGTTLRGLQRGGGAIGIETRAYRVSPGNLNTLVLPAIVHWEGNHWVVLWKVDDAHALIGDPAQSTRRLSRAEFDEAWTGYVAVMTPTAALEEAPLASSGLSWVLPFLRPHRKTIVFALILALVAAAAEVAIPIVSASITDDGILKHDRTVIVVLGGVLLGLAAMSALTLYRQRLALTRTTVSLDVASLDTLTETLIGVPMSYLETRKPGDIERRLTSIQQVNNALTTQGVSAVTALVQLILILVVMFVYSPVLGGAFSACLVTYMLLIRYAFIRIRPIYAALEHAFGSFAAKQVDLLKGLQSVKIVGRRPGIRASVTAALDDLATRRRIAAVAAGRLSASITGVGLAVTALFVFLGALWVVDGQFTFGQFVAFDLLVGLALVPAQLLASLWDDVQKSSVLLNRLQDVFEQEPEQAGRVDLSPVRTLGGHVELQRTSFAFDVDHTGQVRNEQSYVLRDLNLEITPGTTLGLVGRSGSGKSTLLKLLAGLIEPTSGRVLYDGIDMIGLDYGEMRRRIGFVEQSPYLFTATIAENIGLGDPDLDYAQVRRVAEVADAHAFIARLPLGYATPVGDGGLRLSGGQVQRVSIARALYWEPDVILLDEATSALDSESERKVKLSLDHVLEGRTALIVAHRMSTVRDADIIVVLDDGRIVEKGDHGALIKEDGLYAYLYAMQARTS